MSDRDALRQALLSSDCPVYAVVDGAQFENLPELLFASGLAHRPLYRDVTLGDADRRRTVPQFVFLDRTGPLADTADRIGPGSADRLVDPEILQRLSSILHGSHAAVFWRSNQGSRELFQHLRRLNMVLVPKGLDEDDTVEGVFPFEDERQELSSERALDEGEPVRPDWDGYELVLFRHADPNVMAQATSCLAPAQLARLIGDATELIFAPSAIWGQSLERTGRQTGETVSSGPLRFDDAAVSRMLDHQKGAQDRMVAEYLRDAAQELGEGVGDEEFLEWARRGRASASGVGIASEEGIGLWSLALFMTDGAAARDQDILTALRAGGASADEVLREMIAQVVRAPEHHTMWFER